MGREASCMKGALKAPFCLLFTSCSPLILLFPLLSFRVGNDEALLCHLPGVVLSWGSTEAAGTATTPCAARFLSPCISNPLTPCCNANLSPLKALLWSREGWSEADFAH